MILNGKLTSFIPPFQWFHAILPQLASPGDLLKICQADGRWVRGTSGSGLSSKSEKSLWHLDPTCIGLAVFPFLLRQAQRTWKQHATGGQHRAKGPNGAG